MRHGTLVAALLAAARLHNSTGIGTDVEHVPFLYVRWRAMSSVQHLQNMHVCHNLQLHKVQKHNGCS